MAKGPRSPRPPAEGFRLFSLSGIPLVIHPSWLLSVMILTLFTYPVIALPLFRGSSRTVLVVAALVSVIPVAASIVAHELAHALVARAHGMRCDQITLFAFGGVSQIVGLAKRPQIEYQVAIAGPILSLVVATTLAGIARTLEPAAEGLSGAWGAYAWINLALAVFNLIPAFPMDGGRILRSILWRVTGARGRATRWAARVARAFATGLIVLGVFVLLEPLGRGSSPDAGGLWTMLIGTFLFSAAGVAEETEGGDDPR
ncbi:MAG: site-2 protease family protein [Actinomycetota bacterium]